MSMTREEALKKMQAFIDFSPAAKTEIEEIISVLSKPTWHGADEKPHAKKLLLVQLDKDDYKILCLKDLYIDLWCDWCKIFNFIRWVYIDDILPKGGEE